MYILFTLYSSLFSIPCVWCDVMCKQAWRATSTYSLPDYTGEYKLELMACTAPPAQAYVVVDPPACTPHHPQAFPLPLAIQQSHRPVPLVYTLNTVFQLLNTPDLFLQDPREVDNLQVRKAVFCTCINKCYKIIKLKEDKISFTLHSFCLHYIHLHILVNRQMFCSFLYVCGHVHECVHESVCMCASIILPQIMVG